jgi:hypothetical protein
LTESYGLEDVCRDRNLEEMGSIIQRAHRHDKLICVSADDYPVIPDPPDSTDEYASLIEHCSA